MKWLRSILFEIFIRVLFAAACALIGILMAIVILGLRSKIGGK